MKYCPECATPLEAQFVFGRDRPVCPSCGYIVFKGPKLAVAVIASADEKLLLNRRDIDPGRGAWSFLSGYVDLGESPEDAAVREVREEAGVDVVLERVVGVYPNETGSVVLIVYSGRIAGGCPRAGEEVQEVGMFDPHDLPALAFAHDKDIVAEWLRTERNR